MKICRTDFLVLGSGIAGLSYALNVASFGRVTLITKKDDSESNTNYAQGGIASVISEDDSADFHFEDTIRAGDGLCHEDAVRVLVTEGPDRVRELVEWGVRFSYERGRGGKRVFSLGREGGHSRRRIVHASDLTGQEIERALLTRLMGMNNFQLFEDHFASELIVVDQMGETRRCLGAVVYNRLERVFEAWIASVTLLATGGSGRVYLHTTNPEIATGDPTALYPARGKAFLISEAVRGEGAVLIDTEGRPFMKRYDSRGDLAPRDVVARAIDREMKLSGKRHLFLDLSPIDPTVIRRRFPYIRKECLKRGLDITKEPIPVVAAAHYMCGGVLTDIQGRSSIEGLFAVGETACTGVHGANRLASNSLLEAVVFSHRSAQCAKDIHEDRVEIRKTDLDRYRRRGKRAIEAVVVRHLRERLRAMLWECVGIVRSMDRLAMAERELTFILEEIDDYREKVRFSVDMEELRNLGQIAELIVRSALIRKESRGLHYNLDYPERDDAEYRKDTIVVSVDGQPSIALSNGTIGDRTKPILEGTSGEVPP
jgi:L-aspartate oxidase